MRGAADPALALPTFADVEAAVATLAPYIQRTPLLVSPALDRLVGGHVLIKAESLQITGSFKVRGALNALLGLSEEEGKAGVVAWSAGNHGQGVAYAGQLLGIGVTIMMPSDAPTIKIEGTRRWGAEIVLYDRWNESREEIGTGITRRTGATIIPPFDAARIIAGQGTMMLEALSDARAGP